MIDFRYTYLVAALAFFIPWLIFWYRRPDLRREMVVMGLIFMVAGVLTSYFWWTVDWWKPPTITGTRVGLEDFILGFTNGGLAAVLYEAVFGYKEYKSKKDKHVFGGIMLVLLLPFLTCFLYLVFDIPSAIGTAVALAIVGLILIGLRKDLLLPALWGGVLMAALTIPFYYLIMYISPGWVESVWVWDKLSGVKLTGIPIEDVVFYFQVGFVAAPIYDYMMGVRLRKIRLTTDGGHRV